MTIYINEDLLREFEEKLNPSKPEESPIPARILGYGEISTVFEVLDESQQDIAFKRMPLFDSIGEVATYSKVYYQYHDWLAKIGVEIPKYGATTVTTHKGRTVLYLYQKKLPEASIGNKLIHILDLEQVEHLVLIVLRELLKVWDFNAANIGAIQVAIDGQISNWAVKDWREGLTELDDTSQVYYLDTSTPLFRIDGHEQLDVELFLKPTPPGMRWILKKFYLQEIVDRYYDFRKVVIDLIANFYKEQLPEYVPVITELANDFLLTEAMKHDIDMISIEEVEDYYKDDASTWKLYLRMRRFHRFIKTKILRGYYAYILPGKIER
ncbi:MAG: DUF6206 family protein [Candidatus Thorarchaeota archaeon]